MGTYFSPPPTGYHRWATVIQPYVKSTQILVCPSNSKGNLSYGYNWSLGSNGTSIAAVELATQVPMFIEVGGIGKPDEMGSPPSASFLFSGIRKLQPRVQTVAGGQTNDRGAVVYGDRHLEGCNYAFADGHVKWLKSPHPADAFQNVVL